MHVLELVSYAQFLEDIRLYRALKEIENGFYVDVGANHPLDHSVTKLFYEKGWSGINIEPSSDWFDELVKDRPRDINLKLAASSVAGEAVFHDIAGTGLSTLIDTFAERGAAAGYPGTTIKVETRRLDDICDEHVQGEIHFLKIDVEGAEKAVIDGSDFVRHRPWIILIEATEPMTTIANHFDWEPTLMSNGYLFAGSDRVNRYYVAKEHADLLPALSLPADSYRLREDLLEMDRLRQEKGAVDREKAALEREQIALSAAFEQERATVSLARSQIDALQQELAAMKLQIDTLTSSTIWRLTAPLRAAIGVIKKLGRGSG
jgi:FkbM family methyltransferase